MENPSEKSLSFHRSNSFTEEFRWFEKIERWDDFTHRNKQVALNNAAAWLGFEPLTK